MRKVLILLCSVVTCGCMATDRELAAKVVDASAMGWLAGRGVDMCALTSNPPKTPTPGEKFTAEDAIALMEWAAAKKLQFDAVQRAAAESLVEKAKTP